VTPPARRCLGNHVDDAEYAADDQHRSQERLHATVPIAPIVLAPSAQCGLTLLASTTFMSTDPESGEWMAERNDCHLSRGRSVAWSRWPSRSVVSSLVAS